jgi:hypothetical protein
MMTRPAAIWGMATGGALATRSLPCQAPLIVHEWGTITTRHAPDGTPRGRLNHVAAIDTLPQFVYEYEPAATGNDPERSLVKTALVAGRPDVTMRLETPVIYFHQARGSAPIAPFDVSVRFRGGIVNEFFPNGEASVAADAEPGTGRWLSRVSPVAWTGARLDDEVIGRLIWRGVTLHDSVRLAPTSSHVWLAPRRVRARAITTASGESEQYLFYRGVAHLEALLQTRLTGGELLLAAPRDLRWMRAPRMTIARSWLVDIRPDGAVAFRENGPITIEQSSPARELQRLPLFDSRDYGAEKLAELRRSMKRALVAAGLYDDEADALLETWKGSYFTTSGLRLFYLVPNEWLGYYLPLRISTPHELTRVIVGRIDLEGEARN